MRNTGPASICGCWCTFRKSTYGERPGGTARVSGTSAARLTKTWLGSMEAGDIRLDAAWAGVGRALAGAGEGCAEVSLAGKSLRRLAAVARMKVA